MAVHTIKKGLDLPITGAPEARIYDDAPTVSRVAVMAADYPLMKPRMHVSEGDEVKRGSILFEDRKSDNVRFTAPGAGKIVAINRGAKRVLQSVVIELSEGERSGDPGEADLQSFESYTGKDPEQLSREQVVALLVESGAWTALRGRPYDRVPSPNSDAPPAVFVTCTDTNPLAGAQETILADAKEDFARGLRAVAKLTEGSVWLNTHAGSALNSGGVGKVKHEQWQGKHPAGLVGTHIHMLDPVHRDKTVWHLDGQAVVNIGRLFGTGALGVKRIVAIAGPQAAHPRLVRSRLGASLDELTEGQLKPGDNRVIAGSVLCGRTAHGDRLGFLGRYHQIVSVIVEDRERVFMGWMLPGFDKFSVVKAYAAAMLPMKRFAFTTSTNGSPRAMVPINTFERVMPLDVMPTFLLRAIAVNDVIRAESLGAMELAEEDLGLCSFVSPGKVDFGARLRTTLDTIWKEG